MKESGLQWVGLMPSHWSLLKVSRVLRLRSGETLPSDLESTPSDDSYPVFGSTGLIGYSRRTNVSATALILARVGHYAGKVSVVPGPAWISDNALIATLDERRLSQRFAQYLLNAMHLNDLASTTAQPLITSSMVHMQLMPLPDLVEQKAIVAFLDRECRRTRELVQSVRDGIERLTEHRVALIAAGVTGKIDVSSEVAS